MRVLPVFAILAVLCAGPGAAGAAPGDPAPLTADFPLHDNEGCRQYDLDVTALSGGGFAAVWQETSTGFLFLRLFAADGAPTGLPLQVGQGSWYPPRILPGSAGTFRIVWDNETALKTRAFDAAGAPLGPEAVLLSPGPSALDLDVATTELGDGGFAVVTAGDEVVLRRYTADGQPAGHRVLAPASELAGVGPQYATPAVAPRGRSGVVVAWVVQRDGQTFFEGRIHDFAAGSIPFETGPIPVPAPVSLFQRPIRPRVASSAAGTVMVAWVNKTVLARQIVARVFGGDGVPLGEPFPVDPSYPAFDFEPDIVSDSAGSFLVSWIGHQIYLRRVSPGGVPLSTSQAVSTGTYRYGLYWPPVLAIDATDRLLVAFEPQGLYDPAGPQCMSQGLYGRLYDASTGALPLQGGRFRVSVRWTDHQGHTGEGRPVALTADSGYFWFFGPDNLELMVKVLDGRAVNGRFWFSYASLSDVAYTLTVTDTVTGISKDYENPAGRLASLGDTSTFADPAAAAGLLQVAPPAVQALSDTAAGPCAADPPRRPGLCLGDRFEVEVSWTAPALGSGPGQGVPLTTDSGYFWFFGSNNLEMVVKVLDGRAVNGHFWVFFGSLTDVEHRLTVRDTVTGQERVYTNPSGQFHSRADTAAF